MIGVQRSTVSQGECRFHSTKLSWLAGLLEWDAGISDYAQGVVQDIVDEESVSTATPD